MSSMSRTVLSNANPPDVNKQGKQIDVGGMHICIFFLCFRTTVGKEEMDKFR